MSRCPTCGRFPIDIEQRAKEWSDDLNENKSLVKENAALRADLAAANTELERLQYDNEMLIANCFTISEVEEVFSETLRELWRRKSRRSAARGGGRND